MPRTATFEPRKDSNRLKPWRVDLPASIAPTGKRQRFFFNTKQEAANFCEEQRIRRKNFGAAGLEITKAAQLEQAGNAFRLLAPYGVTLMEVVNEWTARRQAAEASVSFEAAMDGFEQWGKRSPSYTRSIRQTRNRLASLHGRLLNTITPADLTQAMGIMPGSVRNFTIRILGGLFNFGMKRGFCADNPCKKLDLSRRETVEIQTHTPAEVGAVLNAAEKHDPALVPFLAVSFFCGVRRAEALRLDWSAIDLHENFLSLPATITKTRQRRHIDLSENCRAWLLPHAKGAGRVTPCTPDVLRKRLTTLKAVHLVPTIKHGARHCFASYWLAKYDEIDRLCRFLGHDDPETTFKHYAKAATKREAEKFWAIMPKTANAENVVAFRRQEALA